MSAATGSIHEVVGNLQREIELLKESLNKAFERIRILENTPRTVVYDNFKKP